MSQKSKRLLASILAVIMAISVIASLLLSLIGSSLAAPTSDELAEEHYETTQQADEFADQAEELQEQAAEVQQRAQEAVEKKLVIDMAIVELEEDIDDVKDEIQQLNLDIAAKQAELDAAVEAEAAMTEQFKTRLRAMEEGGAESYWSVLFRSSSLSDLLDQLAMIKEIGEADKQMQEDLAAARELVALEQQELESARAERSAKQAELEEKQVRLSEVRVQMDELIIELCADNVLLLAAQDEAERMEAELREKSLELLKEYNETLQKEIAQSSANSSNSASASGFLFPLPSGVSWVTDAYGTRWHPIKQAYRFHTGVDFAANSGTSIYATKSGTVVKATLESANGNCVMIQHDDGSASLYAHLSSFAVSYGDYVSQGSVIGYVGSTGWSTGPHLHFEIFINGGNVNPMDYVSLK